MIDASTGKVVQTIVHAPMHENQYRGYHQGWTRFYNYDYGRSTPFRYASQRPGVEGEAIKTGTAIWSPSGENFVEFHPDGIRLFSVQRDGNGVSTSQEYSMTLAEAVRLRNETPNGGVMFGSRPLNAIRNILRNLEVATP